MRGVRIFHKKVSVSLKESMKTSQEGGLVKKKKKTISTGGHRRNQEGLSLPPFGERLSEGGGRAPQIVPLTARNMGSSTSSLANQEGGDFRSKEKGKKGCREQGEAGPVEHARNQVDSCTLPGPRRKKSAKRTKEKTPGSG